ncbi:MAG: signal peptidase II [Myxococcales bacterium]|nr:signal peptidase II [Myxococcales bacterium]
MKSVKFVSALVPLLVALGVGTSVDQWSKAWATRSLATESHPIPLRVDVDGQTPAALIEERFPGALVTLRRLEADGRRAVMRLGDDQRLSPETPVFSEGGAGRTLSMWVFEGESLETPPRRLPAIGQLEADLEAFSGRRLRDYLGARFPADSDERVDRLSRDWTFAVDYTEVGLDAPLARADVVLMMARAVPVIDGFAQLVYAENPGAGWGILGGMSAGFRRLFFQIFTVIALTLLLYVYARGAWLRPEGGARHTPRRLGTLRWAIALLMAGAVGNLIDRIRFNHVIDFVDVYTGELHWPTFNIADVLISVGSVLLIGLTLFRDRRGSIDIALPSPSDSERSSAPGGRDESAPEG